MLMGLIYIACLPDILLRNPLNNYIIIPQSATRYDTLRLKYSLVCLEFFVKNV